MKHAGLIEVPLGITLREVVYDVSGGIKDGKGYKAVQIGGPAGGCLPAMYLDSPIDYDSLVAAGAMMGSGGLVVMDDETCMVDIARFFMEFTQDESCGKCTPCRVGTKRMLEILERICGGEGQDGDIERLELLCKQINATSLCGLGQGAPNPVVSTLRHFRSRIRGAHLREEVPGQSVPRLDPLRDSRRTAPAVWCARATARWKRSRGQRRALHVIDPDICIRCGICMQVCNFNAVAVKSPSFAKQSPGARSLSDALPAHSTEQPARCPRRLR